MRRSLVLDINLAQSDSQKKKKILAQSEAMSPCN